MLDSKPQMLLLIVFIFFGFCVGMMFGIFSAINLVLRRKKYIQIPLDVFMIVLSTILYIIIINLFNWGQHRIYLCIGYLIGILLERKTIGKIFAKLYYKLYNLITNRMRMLSNSKLTKFLKR